MKDLGIFLVLLVVVVTVMLVVGLGSERARYDGCVQDRVERETCVRLYPWGAHR